MSVLRTVFKFQRVQLFRRIRSESLTFSSHLSTRISHGKAQQESKAPSYRLALSFSKSIKLRRRLDNESLEATTSTTSGTQSNGSGSSTSSTVESNHRRPETSSTESEAPPTAPTEASPSTSATAAEAESYHLPPENDNVFVRRTPSAAPDRLRPIVIDGQNVSFVETATGEEREYSYRRLCLCIEYFRQRGHRIVRAVVPRHCQRWIPREIQEELLAAGTLVLTPSRRVGDHANATRITPYDDNYIVQYAALTGAVIVSNDQYHDLYRSHPEWREAIRSRILNFTWMRAEEEDEMLVFPTDPMGRHDGQPTLAEFLRFPGNTNQNSLL